MFGIGLGELVIILIIFGVTGAGMLFTLVAVVMVLRSNSPPKRLEDQTSKQLDQDGTP